MRSLMWFRSDLRLRDNTALTRACKSADAGVVAMFAICREQWEQHDWGQPRIHFLLRNLFDLSAALADRNIPLKIIEAPKFDDLPEMILRLTGECRCDELFFNKEYEVNELERDRRVEELLQRNEIPAHGFTDQVILDVAKIRTKSNGWYSKFTPFKNRWMAQLTEEGPPILHQLRRKSSPIKIKADPIPFDNSVSESGSTDWPAGEAEAKKRLRSFVQDRISGYDRSRDFPASDATSALSPYLAIGAVSPRQCLEAAMAANDFKSDKGNPGIVSWINELIWREFYRHVLIGYPHVCKNRPFRLETEPLPWRTDEADFEAWCTGQTGFPIVDAGMRQLAETGWMHNRVRMITAMFLAKDLFIDWRWGERHFMQHLVDGDFANNNGGWQWSASTGTDSVPYFRIFNPTSQSRRFDPDGEYIRKFVPELRSLDDQEIHEPPASPDYPAPIVDRSESRERVMDAFKQLKQTAAS